MFYIVTESQLKQLAERTTSQIHAFTMDRVSANKSVLPEEPRFVYEYPVGFFPSNDEMNEVTQSDNYKKAMKKLIKKKIKALYRPQADDEESRDFSLAVLSVFGVARKSKRSVMVFVKPDEMSETDYKYYKCLELYLNAIIAEFYYNGKRKKDKYPTVALSVFPPNWVKVDNKKERKHLSKIYKGLGYDVDPDDLKKPMKRKKLRKAIAKDVAEAKMTRSGTNLYDMLKILFEIDFSAATVSNIDPSVMSKSSRKTLALILAKRLCYRGDESAKVLQSNLSDNKIARKNFKKFEKQLARSTKNSITYYKEVVDLFTDDMGVNSVLDEDTAKAKFPKVGKKVGKSKKAFEKTVKKFAKMDAAILCTIAIHIACRQVSPFGTGEYTSLVSRALQGSHKHGDPKTLTKEYLKRVKIVKAATKTEAN